MAGWPDAEGERRERTPRERRAKENARGSSGRFLNRQRDGYKRAANSFLRAAPANARAPVPNSASVEGSGTAVDKVVSPPEIVVEPSKNPLPVLTVNCTLTPFTLTEPIVPLTTPVSV